MNQIAESDLSELFEAIERMPEPLAARLESARGAWLTRDSTGVPKQLFAFGSGVVRYGVAAALALLAARESGISTSLASRLRTSFRMTDGKWHELLREAAREPSLRDCAELLKLGRSKALTSFITARNRFAHDLAPEASVAALTLDLLGEAQALLARQLYFLRGGDPPVLEIRCGMTTGAGRLPKGSENTPLARPNEAYLEVGSDLVRMSPWLPVLEGRILLPEAPLASGGSWRSVDPRTAEHAEHPALSDAMHRLSGDDPSVPRLPTDQPPLVGRDTAKEVLRRLAGEAVAGRVRVVALSGPLGAGRSRLSQEIREAAFGLGFGAVLSASCSSTRRGPLRPLRAALAAQDVLSAALSAALSQEVLANPESIGDALETLERALLDASKGAAILLAIDDLQWADELTVRLLSLLTESAAHVRGARLLCVVSICDDPALSPPLRRLLSEVDRDVGSAATRIVLGPLDDEGAALVVRGTAPVSPTLERSIVHRAGGLPFLLVQPLLVWHESGSLEWKDAVWHPAHAAVLEGPAPGIGELLTARLDSFFGSNVSVVREAERTLATLALVGARVEISELCRVIARDGDERAELELVIDALLEAGLIRSSSVGRYEFCQAMFAEAALEKARSRSWFAPLAKKALRAVEVLEGAEDEAAYLGQEYFRLDDPAAARRWFRIATERALRQGLLEAARESAPRWRDVASSDDERTEALLALIEANWKSGRVRDALEHAQALPEGTTTVLAVRSAIMRRLVEHAAGEEAENREEPCEQLVKAADATGSAKLAVEARVAIASILRQEPGLRLLDEARSLLAANETDAELAHRLHALTAELLYETQVRSDELVGAAKRAHEAAKELGSRWAELDAEADLAVMEFAAGRPDVALDRIRDIERRAIELGFPGLQRNALINRSVLSFQLGRSDEAKAAAEEAVRAAREAASWRHLALARSAESDALAALGKIGPALLAIDEAIDLKASHRDSLQALTLLKKAQLLERGGAHERVFEVVEGALAQGEREGSAQQVAHARLWLGVLAARAGSPGAIEALAILVNTIERESLPPHGAELHREARTLVGQRDSIDN